MGKAVIYLKMVLFQKENGLKEKKKENFFKDTIS